ncbi:V-type proton ATPase subunit E [Hibiscus syriacus]|uniref:V-type proton ATPase subunit E n=1 Tax=Hibiscus syriacus TaxID=106335 RepID=A0A6A3AEZ7_HIBSY|nr:V-type proton ATPase subunit E [Hibiscus syriacus]
MNDGDVSKQIQQMVRFIRQEAEEKANEIAVSAEEEFNIEKLQIVEAERRKIKQEYERKGKQRLGNDKRGYKNLVKALVLQSLARLREPSVILRCREVDRKLVESIIDEAKREYAEKFNVASPKIVIDHLGGSCASFGRREDCFREHFRCTP